MGTKSLDYIVSERKRQEWHTYDIYESLKQSCLSRRWCLMGWGLPYICKTDTITVLNRQIVFPIIMRESDMYQQIGLTEVKKTNST